MMADEPYKSQLRAKTDDILPAFHDSSLHNSLVNNTLLPQIDEKVEEAFERRPYDNLP